MTEWRWLDVFARHLRACALGQGEIVAVLSESSSRPELVETSRIAAQMLGGRVYDVVVPTPANTGPVALRSTGASVALAGNRGVVAALASADVVIDCTVEGLLHAPELGQILGGGARVLMISNEHPENFERYAEDPTLAERVARGVALLEAAAEMRVTSAAGTDLTARLEGAFRAGSSASPPSRARSPTGPEACVSRPRAALRRGRRRARSGRPQPHVQELRPRRGAAAHRGRPRRRDRPGRPDGGERLLRAPAAAPDAGPR